MLKIKNMVFLQVNKALKYFKRINNKSELDNEIATIMAEHEASEFGHIKLADYLLLREQALYTIRQRNKNYKIMVKLLTLLMLFMYFCAIMAHR